MSNERNNVPGSRRIAFVYVSDLMVAMILKDGVQQSDAMTPLRDAKVLKVSHEPENGRSRVLIESPDLEEVKEGRLIPDFVPFFRTVVLTDEIHKLKAEIRGICASARFGLAGGDAEKMKRALEDITDCARCEVKGGDE